MKKLLFFLLLPVYSLGQICADEDTVRNNAVTLITANTARVNGTTTHFSGSVVSMQLRYVRVGQTDTATASAVGTSALRNLTGLQAGTQYVYYYKSICGSGTRLQTIGPYTFTTLTSTVVYAAERSTVFPYVKVDTGFTIPRLDTGSLYRAADIGGNIRFRPADSLPYYYNGEIWKLLAVDSAGILPALNLKVDSVTVAGDSLFYWVNGVSYGYILGTLASNWHTTGNASTSPGTNFIGTTDAQALWINTNGYNRLIVPAAGIASSTASTDSVLVTKTDGVTLGKVAKSTLVPNAWLLASGGTLTDNNSISIGGTQYLNFSTYNDATRSYTYIEHRDSTYVLGTRSKNNDDVASISTSISGTLPIVGISAASITNPSNILSNISVYPDSISIRPYTGKLYIDTLTSAPGTKSLRYNPTSGLVSYADTSTASGSGTVTSVAKGYGIVADGTITTTGTITADTSILVNKTGAQTLTNKTLTSPVINVTSDATGDMYYRNASGLFTRLPIGTAGQHLVGGTIPAWKDTAAGGSAYTFSTGLTNTSGTITNNLSTGVGAAQSINGTTTSLADAVGLTINSTTVSGAANKGRINFGSGMSFSEYYGSLGIGTTSSTVPLHVLSTGTAYNGLKIENTTNSSYARQDWVNNNGDITQMLLTGSSYNNGIFTPNSASFYNAGGGGTNIGAAHASGVIRFFTAGYGTGNEIARFTTDGKLGIGTTTPSTSSALDITSTTKGLLIPRMTTTERNAISSPATALQIFSTTDSTNYLYRGTTSGWQATLTGIRGSGTLDFGSIAHHSEEVLTISVTGAAEGDVVSLGIPNASNLANVIFTAWVSAANTVSVKCSNLDASASKDPASGTFKVTIIKF